MSPGRGHPFEAGQQVRLRHGDKTRTYTAPEYETWSGMIARCHTPTHKRYGYYGARGITVCDRWRGESGYEAFLADMGRKPTPKHSIERKDNNGNYEPSNCRWATRSEQMRNTRATINVTIGGETACLKEWSARVGRPYKIVHQRIKSGWDPERALREPINTRRARKPPHAKLEASRG